ncbi:MAG: GTP 3',8-cyclase MoaA [Antricoccus sp.]
MTDQPLTINTRADQEKIDQARDAGLLVDQFGRIATDLRISLTDKCNLRCTYCMPAEGLPWLPKEEVLTDDEIVRLIHIAVERLGVRELRFTGGEPLLRAGLVNIVAQAAQCEPRPDMSLTTNALGLAKNAQALADAGLNRVNVSLDTLNDVQFTALTRRNRLADTIAGIEAAAAAGLTPVKINSVLMRDINEHEAPALLQWCLDRGYELRFIEQMPIDGAHIWDRHTMVTAEEILKILEEKFTLTPDPAHRGAAPAETWLVNGGPQKVGIIGSVTRPFCGDCDRTRLTADGQIRNCLFAREESDLRGALRSDATDDEIANRWRIAMWGKRAGHGINDETFLQPARPMSAIGG